jgi:hypothetical protein
MNKILAGGHIVLIVKVVNVKGGKDKRPRRAPYGFRAADYSLARTGFI